MRCLRATQMLSRSLRTSTPIPVPKFMRHSSTQATLYKELTSREPHYIYDYTSPMPTHLLNITLADFLPTSCQPPGFDKDRLPDPYGHDTGDIPLEFPQGHHLVYFPPQVPSSKLLPDGTDPLQSPGEPFVRRMWAGGSLMFCPNGLGLNLNAKRYCCVEKITDVSVKGTEGKERVFVTIERRTSRAYDPSLPPESRAAVLETRNLVFMREKTPEAAKEDAARPDKILKPAHEPDSSVSMTPTQQLLFRFSALSFNAHGIHLDPQYTREIEGHRNLLVHGPLSLVLMLSVLRSQVKEQEMIYKFDYRNLAPLYAGEEMRICVRKDRENGSKFDVWIEGSGGGYAVKGSALLGPKWVGTNFENVPDEMAEALLYVDRHPEEWKV